MARKKFGELREGMAPEIAERNAARVADDLRQAPAPKNEQTRNALGQAVDGRYSFEPVTMERLMRIEQEVMAERAATRKHADRPAGYFADLGDDAVCVSTACVRPFLAAGKTVYAFTGGRESGRVACVECARAMHVGIEAAWEQKLGHLKGFDAATIARMIVGEVTDRYGDRERERYEVHGDEQTRDEAGDYRPALPRM